MKIQSKLVLYVGGAAVCMTLLMLVLAALRLTSIFNQLDAQNEAFDTAHFKYTASSVFAVESRLLSESFDEIFHRLIDTCGDMGRGGDSDLAAMREALKATPLASAIVFREFPSTDSQEAPELLVKRDSSALLSSKGISFLKGDPLLAFAMSKDACKTGSLVLADSLEDRFGAAAYAAVVAPCRNGRKECVAVLAFAFDSDFIWRELRQDLRSKSEQDSFGFAICGSPKGAMINSLPKGSKVPMDVKGALAAPFGDADKGGLSCIKYESSEAGSWLLASAPLAIPVFGVFAPRLAKMSVFPATFKSLDLAMTAQVKIEDLLFSIAIIMLLSLLMFFPPMIMIAKGIADPLRRAAAFSNTLAKGEFPSDSLPQSGSEEMAELSRSLNHMRDRLSNTISKLRKSHEREMQARKDAESANHLKSDFLANMSLELRNPLNSIMGFSSLILKDADKGMYDMDLRGKARAIYESAEGLNSLVSTLLDLSKLDMANTEPNISEFEPATLVRELVEASLPLASEKSVVVESHYSPDAPKVIATDREMLSHILSLTITSLLKSGPDGRKVLVGCNSMYDKVFFWVKDVKTESGGESLAAMSLKYSDSQQELLPTLAGTVLLNLTIARNQSHILGAEFMADSNDEANSIFTVSFLKAELVPLSTLETSSIHTASNLQRPLMASMTDSHFRMRRQPRHPGAPVSVLMAEDNESNRMLVELVLKDTNFKMDWVADGLACLDRLGEKKYDILLLDLHMPRLDGYSVLGRIRQDRTLDLMPVIVLTAYLEEGDKEKLIRMGASKCILKPINLDEILETIRAFTS